MHCFSPSRSRQQVRDIYKATDYFLQTYLPVVVARLLRIYEAKEDFGVAFPL
jgi:hypothetical protein